MPDRHLSRRPGPRVSPPVLALGLLVAYAPMWLPLASRALGIPIPAGNPGMALLWNWLAVGLLALHVCVVERRGPASLRLVRPSERDLEWAGYLGGAAVLWHWLTSLLLPPSVGEERLVALGPMVILALVLTSAISEEVLWRGYVGAWIGLVPAGLLGLAVFAVPHVSFFGPSWLLTTLPGAAVLYLLLIWRRNLWACMLAHLIGNVPVLLVTLWR